MKIGRLNLYLFLKITTHEVLNIFKDICLKVAYKTKHTRKNILGIPKGSAESCESLELY